MFATLVFYKNFGFCFAFPLVVPLSRNDTVGISYRVLGEEVGPCEAPQQRALVCDSPTIYHSHSLVDRRLNLETCHPEVVQWNRQSRSPSVLGSMEDHRERDGTGYALEEFDKTSLHVHLPQYKCQMQDVDIFFLVSNVIHGY